MVMIPISVFYFILGFVTCFVLIIIWVNVSINNQRKQRKEMLDEFTKNLVDSMNNKDENK